MAKHKKKMATETEGSNSHNQLPNLQGNHQILKWGGAKAPDHCLAIF